MMTTTNNSNLLISFPPSETIYPGSPGRSQSNLSYDSLPAIDPCCTYPEELTTDVQLDVNGASFVLNSRDFQKLANLPWQRVHAGAYRLDEGTTTCCSSPEAFEYCLNYALFSTLPKKRKMTSAEKAEVASMARTLGFLELADHVASSKSSRRRGGSTSNSSSSSQRKSGVSSAGSPRKKSFGLASFFFCSRVKSSDVEQAYYK